MQLAMMLFFLDTKSVMRRPNLLPILVAAAVLSTVSFSHSQDGPFARLFAGVNAPSQSQKKPGFGLGGPKRVEINLTDQVMRAYEGDRLVMRTRISSGRNRGTPTGSFRAGPYKSAEHYSSLYYNAPMPWSVQVSGHIFIHGFTEVPNYPASRGCIRVPLTGMNPAKRFYNWVDVGTPIRISY